MRARRATPTPGNQTSTKNQWEQCSSTCNSTLDSDVSSLIEKCGTASYRDHMNYTAGDKSWYEVCAWQGITQLPKMCNDTFSPTLPTAASNNFGKTVNDSSLQDLVVIQRHGRLGLVQRARVLLHLYR